MPTGDLRRATYEQQWGYFGRSINVITNFKLGYVNILGVRPPLAHSHGLVRKEGGEQVLYCAPLIEKTLIMVFISKGFHR